ncbi:zinc ribbon domain-containing protein [Gaiella sp.]|uniref:FmdB family zinc ribbon protein n=1 Tax=Gaiella sp. TaxID=2663207 RepID=UPI0032660F74
MPIYEYRCPNGHTFEMFQRMSDAPAETCETCGASPVEKILFPVAVHYKGSGFYSTDYGRGSRKGTGKEGDGGSSSGNGGSSGDGGGSTEKSESSSEKKDAKKDSGSSDKKPASSD